MHKTPGRNVQIWGEEINYYSLGKIRDKIEILLKEDSEAWITLEISSGGGEVLAGFALYDWIRMHEVKLQTIALAHVQSMAIILYLAGEHRVATPNSFFYLHPVSKTYSEKASLGVEAHARAIEELASFQKRYIEVVKLRADKAPENLTDVINKTVTLSPDEAQNWNMVHEVLPAK